jgi:hypothetical protein
MKVQKTVNSQSNPEPKEQRWSYHNTDFKLYYRAIIIKQHGTGTKIDMKTSGTKWRTTDTNPCNYNQLIFNKGAQNMHWRKDSLFIKWF